MIRIWRRIKFIFQVRRSIPFLKDFFTSKEVKGSHKGLSVILFLAYLIFPFDVIPDWLAVIGLVDDLAVLAFILQKIVKMAPDSLKEKHGL
ncbi:YkvA family protein [Thalassobacillus sp. B23F22_16]|uniref:YkvA family protein n=1 Tax=Thalassobacillus sp. B23F22_16 TaxID=3459513 RepID=UPI00373F7E53